MGLGGPGLLLSSEAFAWENGWAGPRWARPALPLRGFCLGGWAPAGLSGPGLLLPSEASQLAAAPQAEASVGRSRPGPPRPAGARPPWRLLSSETWGEASFQAGPREWGGGCPPSSAQPPTNHLLLAGRRESDSQPFQLWRLRRAVSSAARGATLTSCRTCRPPAWPEDSPSE